MLAPAAARAGANVVLLENQGCLGGVWTDGMLSLILATANVSSLMSEILQRCRDAQSLGPWGGSVYDVETMKLLLEEMCLESGVQDRLHRLVCVALKNESGRLTHVITENKMFSNRSRRMWAAKLI